MAFDYMNSGALIMGSSRGGVAAFDGAENSKGWDKDKDRRGDGNIKTAYEDGKISCIDVPLSRFQSSG